MGLARVACMVPGVVGFGPSGIAGAASTSARGMVCNPPHCSMVASTSGPTYLYLVLDKAVQPRDSLFPLELEEGERHFALKSEPAEAVRRWSWNKDLATCLDRISSGLQLVVFELSLAGAGAAFLGGGDLSFPMCTGMYRPPSGLRVYKPFLYEVLLGGEGDVVLLSCVGIERVPPELGLSFQCKDQWLSLIHI